VPCALRYRRRSAWPSPLQLVIDHVCDASVDEYEQENAECGTHIVGAGGKLTLLCRLKTHPL
jgi:hypothetical protein